MQAYYNKPSFVKKSIYKLKDNEGYIYSFIAGVLFVCVSMIYFIVGGN